ncbi:MATE family efflux transporter [Leptospira sp. GIMC2001]|uniref:MATE family efflux transporter n=1 Tax=Leptospira sp. GIMC2001 TaxID=1513297 RepID=UPI0023490B31|nr:MATE family efflux transporter [Leptospira sp. GIMC2001]WCL49437.1 MATE family efflux transporter [Leptospira sp. GIMC2001]
MYHRIIRVFQPSRLNKKIIFLSIPVFIGMVNHTAIMIADTAMVGKLGALALASTGFGGVTYFTVLSFLMGASIAVQILTSRRFGEKKMLEVGKVGVNAIYFSLALGLVMSIGGFYLGEPLMAALADDPDVQREAGLYLSYRFIGTFLFFFIFFIRGYFDGLGFTYVGMVSAFLTTGSNIFFNWILIYGNLGFPAMGVQGAAIASSLSGIPGALVFVIYLFTRRFRIYFLHTSWVPNLAIFKEITFLGTAPAIEQMLTNISFIIFTKFAGLVGTVTMAASNIVFSTLSLSFMPGFAFGIAATTILGQAVGQGKYRLAYEGTMRAANYSAIVMGTMGVIFIVFGEWIISFFTIDIAVVREAYPALVIVALIQVGDAYHMVVGSALRSAGLVYWVATVYILTSFIVMLPWAYFFGVYMNYGNPGLWSSIFLWLLILAIAFVTKFRKKDWIGVKV